jgi:hypothetical protein
MPPLSISNLLDRQTETEYLQTYYASRFVDFAMYIRDEYRSFCSYDKGGRTVPLSHSLKGPDSFLRLILVEGIDRVWRYFVLRSTPDDSDGPCETHALDSAVPRS